MIEFKYGNKAHLQYTDSLTDSVQTKDIYEGMKEMIKPFDIIEYPEDIPYHMPRINRKVLWEMKDKLHGRIMCEFISL